MSEAQSPSSSLETSGLQQPSHRDTAPRRTGSEPPSKGTSLPCSRHCPKQQSRICDLYFSFSIFPSYFGHGTRVYLCPEITFASICVQILALQLRGARSEGWVLPAPLPVVFPETGLPDRPLSAATRRWPDASGRAKCVQTVAGAPATNSPVQSPTLGTITRFLRGR